jgi:hypothetical protein
MTGMTPEDLSALITILTRDLPVRSQSERSLEKLNCTIDSFSFTLRGGQAHHFIVFVFEELARLLSAVENPAGIICDVPLNNVSYRVELQSMRV